MSEGKIKLKDSAHGFELILYGARMDYVTQYRVEADSSVLRLGLELEIPKELIDFQVEY